ncbi:flagellar hook-associated protein FlgK [Actimicrobium sp. CCC2.4]|uniref:flagellar hook-associated protein FlgK n=1 Tax=Actimicrobium sp. CCC2.4 TaxID=3048606 RepID=UPI002AC8D516|nr:flagellar hook-associated protein FlgK [Actimicrobium sp. CCC2.4]MEB0135242.1 flagellar hook-associated protein FlgK [Actimicrobium sp. CCC2.4]WPX31036.1 flagellar hook-associated protein FlgK [Actimicrobium sp. CCC2.4]
MGNILSVGQSGLLAAQLGVTTTGHNIANAATPGYSRQVVIQTSAGGQSSGDGFVGQGTTVASIQRIYDAYTATRVNAAQTSKASLDAYSTQVSHINNLLADSSTGLSPTLSNFFNNVQGLAAAPNGSAQRQTLLSAGESLAARFQSLDSQLSQIGEGVNAQIVSNVGSINAYGQQIAKLNDAIEKATSGAGGAPPNDLLDQRDQIVSELSKLVKVSVDNQPGSGYNVSIGNGQPIVVGTTTFALSIATSQTDASKLVVAYQSGSTLLNLPDSSISGGTLGGLLDFRTNSLDPARNELGRVAIGLAASFNEQSKLGVDQNGNPGKNFFTVAGPLVAPNKLNASTNPALSATIASSTDAASLTASDYSVAYDGTNYTITRLSDNVKAYQGVFPPTVGPVDGITFSVGAGTMVANSSFLVRPTISAAGSIAVNLTDTSEIAAAAPVVLAASGTNGGNGKISAGSVDASFLTAPPTLPLKLKFSNGTFDTVPASLTTPITYVSGANVTLNGVSFSITGAPLEGDTFTINANTTGVATGDNRNAVALGALQTKKLLVGVGTTNTPSTTLAGAFGLMVNNVGNKTREVMANAASEGKLVDSVLAIQQSQSGVNLDEEASNLLRYQQAYQAAGKIMQTASTLFDVLLSLGR